MKKYEGKLAGILGTVIIHLIAAILFMSFQLRSLNKQMQDILEVEIAPDDMVMPEQKEQPPEAQSASADKSPANEEEMLNIARNLANKGDPKINRAELIDQVKEELIKSGKLWKDNFIDEQKQQNDSKNEENIAIKKDTAGQKKDKPQKLQEMEANYKGPTRIYYNLPGRTHTYLPIPIYKCEGKGEIVLSIQVNQNGIVEKASVIETESSTSDPCLIDTAVSAALDSRFNADVNSPRIETGTLSYQFVAQ